MWPQGDPKRLFDQGVRATKLVVLRNVKAQRLYSPGRGDWLKEFPNRRKVAYDLGPKDSNCGGLSGFS